MDNDVTLVILPPAQSHRTAEETLGVGYIAAALRRKGFKVAIIDGWLRKLSPNEIIHEILKCPPKIFIGISLYLNSLEKASSLIKRLRVSGVETPFVCGGYPATFHSAEMLNAGFDFALTGEAESSVVCLAKALRADLTGFEEVEGLVYRNNAGQIITNRPTAAPSNLDLLPTPARDTIRETIKRKNPVALCTSRGCTAYCSFCSIAAFQRRMSVRKYWRQRSIGNIMDELSFLHDTYGVNCFKFVDDSFIEPPRNERWTEELLNALEKRHLKIRFRTQIRADRLNENIARNLKEAGWFATSLGVENGSASALKRMGKAATLDQNLRALELLERHGIYVQMGLILFDQETTFPELEENAAFLRRLYWPVTKGIFTEMYAAPGTRIADKLRKEEKVLAYTRGGYAYKIEDPRANTAHKCLKLWHGSHSVVYDRAIDPISAPKVLPREGYEGFRAVCGKLYRADVDFLFQLLEIGKHPRADAETMNFTEEEIVKKRGFYHCASEELDRLETKFGLNYDGDPNPLL